MVHFNMDELVGRLQVWKIWCNYVSAFWVGGVRKIRLVVPFHN